MMRASFRAQWTLWDPRLSKVVNPSRLVLSKRRTCIHKLQQRAWLAWSPSKKNSTGLSIGSTNFATTQRSNGLASTHYLQSNLVNAPSRSSWHARLKPANYRRLGSSVTAQHQSPKSLRTGPRRIARSLKRAFTQLRATR